MKGEYEGRKIPVLLSWGANLSVKLIKGRREGYGDGDGGCA